MGETKLAAENELAVIASRTALGVSSLRFPMVYGAGAKGSFHLLEQAVLTRFPLPFGSIQNRRAFVAIDNLASFVRKRSAPGSNRSLSLTTSKFRPANSPVDSDGRLVAPRLIPVPLSMLRTGLRRVGAGDLAESILGSLEVDMGKARATGWRPVVSMDEALRRTTQRSV
jgi:UDP-glucose 4-epimerase